MGKNRHIGSSFNDFLESEGISHEVEAIAIKRYLAVLVERKMEEDSISKSRMAELMGTSRSVVTRLLDPENDSLTLHTLVKAAKAIGKKIRLELE